VSTRVLGKVIAEYSRRSATVCQDFAMMMMM